jgi:NAD(P)-dependent dehydrogenase (short-subunit alcohol dehydrogenase family)
LTGLAADGAAAGGPGAKATPPVRLDRRNARRCLPDETPAGDRRNPVMTSHLPGGEPGVMSERVAIVVGAAGELGRATAKALVAAGFTVVGADRDKDGLEELPDGIRREVGDPTDPVVARSLVDRIAAEVGPPAVLVNTIGMYHLGDALTATPDDLRLMIDVNVGPALWLTQAAAVYMRDRGSGAVVHVSARPGLEPTAGMATYGVSKAALAHLVRVLDLELRPLGIRVNGVAPLLIDTAKNRPYLTPEQLSHAVAPEAIADVIAFLVSDAAAPVSGALLPAYGA